MTVGGGEAMDMGGPVGVTAAIDLPGLDGVAGGIDEARLVPRHDAVRGRGPRRLGRRGPVAAERLGLPPLGGGERRGALLQRGRRRCR